VGCLHHDRILLDVDGQYCQLGIIESLHAFFFVLTIILTSAQYCHLIPFDTSKDLYRVTLSQLRQAQKFRLQCADNTKRPPAAAEPVTVAFSNRYKYRTDRLRRVAR